MIFFTLAIVKCKEKYLDTTKPRCSVHILPVLSPFVISRFHCSHILKLWATVSGHSYLAMIMQNKMADLYHTALKKLSM